jgi:hypothetical protein
VRKLAAFLLLALPLFGDTFPNGSPHSTNNDDSCDIAALPAATLLLPYFEVDLDDGDGETTLFTVTNVADRAKIVAVTLWTDHGFPVVTFHIYLTGYDVQSINLRDVLAFGRIGGEGTGTSVSPVGELSNPAGPGYDVATCTNIPHLSPEILARVQHTFLEGQYVLPFPGLCPVGSTHANAVGYVTMDVVTRCGAMPASSQKYFNEDIRYENVLIGEYQQLNPAQASAQGGTMVHIRAIPESKATGGLYKANNFPRSFYQRLVAGDSLGRINAGARQPLPSTFVARWISGGPGGFETSFKIWRSLSGREATDCGIDGDYTDVAEIVVFDEAENAVTQARPPRGDPPRPEVPADLPAVALAHIDDDEIFPTLPNGAIAGWVYFNLDSRDEDANHAEQAWVITSLHAEGRYSGDLDATALGNGCSPRVLESEISSGGAVIGPSPNTTP